MDNGFTSAPQESKLAERQYRGEYDVAGSSEPASEVQPVGAIVIETSKFTQELLAMSGEISRVVGGSLPEGPKGSSNPGDLRSALMAHRADLARLAENLRRTIRYLKG